MNKTDELRTARIGSLITPVSLAADHPVSAAIADNVTAHAAPERRNVLASEYEQFAASPATAVKNVLIQPRAPAIYAAGAVRPPYAAGGSPYPRP